MFFPGKGIRGALLLRPGGDKLMNVSSIKQLFPAQHEAGTNRVAHSLRRTRSVSPDSMEKRWKEKGATKKKLEYRHEEEKHEEERISAALGMSSNQMKALNRVEKDMEEAAEAYLTAFEKYDIDGSGDISPEELREVLVELGEKEEDFDDIVAQADTDGDGTINYEEFVNMMTARKRLVAMANVLGSDSSNNVEKLASGLPPLKLPMQQESRKVARKRKNLYGHQNTKKRKPVVRHEMKQGELKRELALTQQVVKALDAKVKKDVEWVQENCNVTSLRAQMYCKRWGMQKLQNIMRRLEYKEVIASWKIWNKYTCWKRNQGQVEQYMKLKGSRRLASLFANWKRKKSMAAINSWIRIVHHQRHMENEAGCIEIQRVARGFQGRRVAFHRRRKYAAIDIQRIARGILGRKRFEAMTQNKLEWSAAVCIQGAFRGYQGKKLAKIIAMSHKENKCASRIQASWRGRRDRKRFGDILAQKLKDVAVTKIAKVYRGYVVREYAMSQIQAIAENIAAMIIQTCFRGYFGRTQGLELMETRMQLIAEEEASLKIQAAFRGWNTRNKVRQLKLNKAVVLVQKIWRAHKQRNGYRMIKLEKQARERIRNHASIILQCFFRTTTAKIILMNRLAAKNAALSIQRIRRGQVGRRTFQNKQQHFIDQQRSELLRRKQNAAALRIQTRWRSHKGRLAYQLKQQAKRQALASHQHSSVTILQARIRGNNDRKRFQELQKAKLDEQELSNAALTVQSCIRGKMARKKVQAKQSEAAAAMQKLRQQEEIATEEQNREAAAIRIQASLRAKHATEVVQERKKANEEIHQKSKALEEEQAQTQAALQIQNRIRMVNAKKELQDRKQYLDQQLAASKDEEEKCAIQAQYKRREAAIKIQSMLRCRREKAKLQVIKKAQKEQELQLREATDLITKELAAIKIQTLFRTRRDVKKVQGIKDRLEWEKNNIEEARKQREEKLAKEKQDQELAALKMQSVLRGRKARIEVQARKKKFLHEKKLKQRQLEERKREDAMEQAALRIQCAFRTRKAKQLVRSKQQLHQAKLAKLRELGEKEIEIEKLKQEQEQEIAATKMQAIYRSKAARLQTQAKKKERERDFEQERRRAAEELRYISACRIQSVFRGNRDRKIYEQQRSQMASQKTAKIDSLTSNLNDSDTNSVWVEYWDDASQAYYYFNTVTQEARWTDPRASAGNGYETGGAITDYDTDNYDATYAQGYYDEHGTWNAGYYDEYGSWVNSEAPHAASLVDPTYSWEQYYDDSYQAAYYYNLTTGETVWENPSGFYSPYASPELAPRYS